MSKYKILFKLTGSIACYKACTIISKLVQSGHEVYPVVTQAAMKFVGLSTLEGLTRKPVYHDMWERKTSLHHIDLIKMADLTILCPATANMINKMSAGIADDVVSTLFLAHDFNKPYLLAPAMNMNMYNHPSTQNSLEILKDWGIKILGTDIGHQACGDNGPGRLLAPELIFKKIENELGKNS